MAEDIDAGAHTVVADVAAASEVKNAVRGAIHSLGGLDVVVNAAGVAGHVALEDLTEGRWHEVLETNLSGTFYVAREAALHMRRSGGAARSSTSHPISPPWACQALFTTARRKQALWASPGPWHWNWRHWSESTPFARDRLTRPWCVKAWPRRRTQQRPGD